MLIKESIEPAQICVIWMHGLGSSAENMMMLVEQLPLSLAARHICLNAPVRPVTLNAGMAMRAWYDIVGLTLAAREDKVGILASEQLIAGVIDAQLADGFLPHQIYLAGFSQGGAMSLFAGLRSGRTLGGIISLSSYLPLVSLLATDNLRHQLPIFIALGLYDQVVLPGWTQGGVDWLHTQGFDQIDLRRYPMEHTICFEELNEIADWLMRHAVSTRKI